MLDIGWSELLVVAVVAIVIVGPKELPRMMRTFGRYAGKLRRAAGDFQRQFQDAMAESEAEEVRKNIESIRSGFGAADLNRPVDRPIMMPTTPAPASIEQAIPSGADPGSPKPRRKRTAPKRKAPAANASANTTPTNKTSTKKRPAKKTAAKRKRKARRTS